MKIFKQIRLLLAFLILSLFLSCSKKVYTGRYAESNNFIHGVYTHYFNERLGVSTDFYTSYNADSTITNYLPRDEYENHRKIVQSLFKQKIKPRHFVYKMNSGFFRRGQTILYCMPKTSKDELLKEKISDDLYTRVYRYTANGKTYFQFFSSTKKNEDFIKESDAIMRRFSYKDYYKISYSTYDKILLDFSKAEKMSNEILDEKTIFDSLFIKNNQFRVVAIPLKDTYLTVDFLFPKKIKKIINKGGDLYIKVYNKKEVNKHKTLVNPILDEKLLSNKFSMEFDVSYEDYILVIQTAEGEILKAMFLNIW